MLLNNSWILLYNSTNSHKYWITQLVVSLHFLIRVTAAPPHAWIVEHSTYISWQMRELFWSSASIYETNHLPGIIRSSANSDHPIQQPCVGVRYVWFSLVGRVCPTLNRLVRSSPRVTVVSSSTSEATAVASTFSYYSDPFYQLWIHWRTRGCCICSCMLCAVFAMCGLKRHVCFPSCFHGVSHSYVGDGQK